MSTDKIFLRMIEVIIYIYMIEVIIYAMHIKT